MKKICSALLAAALAVGTIFSPGAAAQDPGWSPDDIAGLKAWYDAAKLQLEDGEKVDAWANQAGNAGYDAAQPDASKQPVFQASGKINGKPGVRFQQHTNLKLAESFSLDDFTIFAVVNPDEMVNAGDANQIFPSWGFTATTTGTSILRTAVLTSAGRTTADTGTTPAKTAPCRWIRTTYWAVSRTARAGPSI